MVSNRPSSGMRGKLECAVLTGCLLAALCLTAHAQTTPTPTPAPTTNTTTSAANDTCTGPDSIAEVLAAYDRPLLLRLLGATPLLPLLTTQSSNYTLFAPSDEALLNFARTLELDLTQPVTQLPIEALSAILAHHVVPTALRSGGLEDGLELATLLANTTLVSPEAACPADNSTRKSLTVSILQPSPTTTPLVLLSAAGSFASVVTRDIAVCGGRSLVHLLDDVLVPCCQDLEDAVYKSGQLGTELADKVVRAAGAEPSVQELFEYHLRTIYAEEKSSVANIFVPTSTAWAAFDLSQALGMVPSASQAESALIYLAAYHLARIPSYLTLNGTTAVAFPTFASSTSASLSGLAASTCVNNITVQARTTSQSTAPATSPAVSAAASTTTTSPSSFTVDVIMAFGSGSNSSGEVAKKSDTCPGVDVIAVDAVLLPCDLAQVVRTGTVAVKGSPPPAEGGPVNNVTFVDRRNGAGGVVATGKVMLAAALAAVALAVAV